MSGSNGGFNPANPALTPDAVADALQRHEAGDTWTAIANDLGVTVAALLYHHRKAIKAAERPVPAPPATEPASDDDLAAIITVSKRARGVSDLRDLLDALGLTPRKVLSP